MKKLLFIPIILAMVCLKAQKIDIATYNLRYKNTHDTGNLWQNRLPVIADMVKFYDWDIVATQEVLPDQLTELQSQLTDYNYYGIGRDENQTGEACAVFYKKNKYQLKDKGTFWLSPTPDKISKGWDAQLNRICSWVKLLDIKSKKEFFVFNTHFDHQANTARLESSKLILKKIKEIAQEQPVILLGDLNSGRDTQWFETLKNSSFLKEAYVESSIKLAYNGTFNEFGASIESKEIIDHIFFSQHFKVSKYAILSNTYFGKYPSDHFPVMSVIKWK